MLVAMIVFLGLNVTGIVLLAEDHSVGIVLIIASFLVAGVFHLWSRRRWAEHRARLG